MPSGYSGVTFANRLRETRDFNVFTYRNFYNGGGVAIGDLTGDGLPEIVLTSNQDGPRLYLNLGKFRFRDVTEGARVVEHDRWTTGVTLADVNGDGKLDLLVGDCVTLLFAQAGVDEATARKQMLECDDRLMKLYTAQAGTAEETAKQRKTIEAVDKEREKYVREEHTGFVWLFRQK